MIRHLLLLACGVFPSTALGTVQEPDVVVVEGKRLVTYSLLRIEDVLPDIDFPEFEMISTANRKGWSATWATFQKQLYLVGIEGRVRGKNSLVGNNDVIPRRLFPIKVTKWSGTIVQTEQSSSLDVDTMIWTDVTETTTVTVKEGLVTDTKVVVKRKPRSSIGSD